MYRTVDWNKLVAMAEKEQDDTLEERLEEIQAMKRTMHSLYIEMILGEYHGIAKFFQRGYKTPIRIVPYTTIDISSRWTKRYMLRQNEIVEDILNHAFENERIYLDMKYNPADFPTLDMGPRYCKGFYQGILMCDFNEPITFKKMEDGRERHTKTLSRHTHEDAVKIAEIIKEGFKQADSVSVAIKPTQVNDRFDIDVDVIISEHDIKFEIIKTK